MTSDSRFDPQAVEMLRRVGGERLVGRMAQIFKSNAPARLEAARAAARLLQAEEFSRAMHSLRSSAGQIGARRLQACCAELESAPLSAATAESILRALDEAVNEMNDAVAWLDGALSESAETK